VAAVGLVVFPKAVWLLLGVNVLILIVAVIDFVASPPPSVLEIARAAPDRYMVGTPQRVVLRVLNKSRYRLRVRWREGVPDSLVLAEVERSGLVPAESEAEWAYKVVPRTRGRFEWGPIYLRYRSRLGLWEFEKIEPASGFARVFPDMKLLERYHLLARADRLGAIGVRRVRVHGVSTEFESLREYVFGDDIRQMDWKATARRARLIVRNQEAERHQTVLLLLDFGRLMTAADHLKPKMGEEVDAAAESEPEAALSKLDHAINASLLLSYVALSRGDRVGICTFSGEVHNWLAPRASMAQNRLIGETLYDLPADLTESDHAACLKFVAARYPKRSLLVVMTDFVDRTTSAAMVAHLKLAARRHVVLFAAMKDAFLEKISLAETKTVADGFRKAAALELLRERREVLEEIRHAGGFVVDTDPGDIAPAVISNYLEVMLRGLL
jgi:uncharacterized protein (DUF58 family)